MPCPNCGEPVRVSKSLQRGKSDERKECPNCGESLEKSSDTTGNHRLRK